jgi:hypothetical protein
MVSFSRVVSSIIDISCYWARDITFHTSIGPVHIPMFPELHSAASCH